MSFRDLESVRGLGSSRNCLGKEVRFTVKRAGANESKRIVIPSGQEGSKFIIFDAPLPLLVEVDIKFCCTLTLFLINERRQFLGKIELGEIFSDSVCIKPSEILNSREIINRVICNRVLDMTESAKDAVVAAVIWEMNKFAKQDSSSNPPLLLYVDIKGFGDQILDEQSPAYDMLEDCMEYISVVSASRRNRKRHHSHDDDDDSCIICFSEFCSEDSKLMCPCEHVFHRNCILKWLTRTPSCPICRFEMKIHLDARDHK